MKISIIIPTFNSEDFIIDTIDNIRSEINDQIELIVINDGSTDRTLEILNNYRLNVYHKLIVLDQANTGPSGARNAGINKSVGDYIFFVDSDDFLVKNSISSLINKIEKQSIESDIIIFGANIVSTNMDSISLFTYDDITCSDNNLLDVYFDISNTKSVVWNKLYRRNFIIYNNLQFNDHRIGEDFLFNLKVFSLAKNVSYFSGLYYLHRSINSNSYTNSLSCSKIIVLNDAYLDGKEFLSKNKYSLEVIYQYQVLYIKLLSHMLFIASFNSLSLSGFIASYQTARLVIPQFNYFNSIKFSASIILRVFIIRSPYLIWLLSKALKTIGYRTQ